MYETFRTETSMNGKINKQASEKVEKFSIKFRRSVNVALELGLQLVLELQGWH